MAVEPRTAEQTSRTVHAGLRYLPALDGLRALALTAVLLYHQGFAWARGGFLGVTVFFALSGFLITSLLLREHRTTGRIGLRAFWGRRARRLVPAVLVLLVLVVYLLATQAVDPRPGLVGDAAATGGWVANWRFILDGQTYGDLFGDPSPFQHMWSLAIEEQFYLLLPVVAVCCLGRRGRRGRSGRWLLGGVAFVALAASALLCAQLFEPSSTGRAYYGTDTRMAEPLVGVVLALTLVRGTSLRLLGSAARRLLGTAGLLALVGLGLLVHGLGAYDARLFRGGFLLAAVLGAVVVAAATQPRTVLARLLSLPPLVLVGRVSYGAYVYHWPVFLLLSPQETGLADGPLFALRCAVTLALAGLSYVLVESPVRAGWLPRRVALAGWVPATAALVALMSLAVTSVPHRQSPSLSASGDDIAVAPPVPTVAPRHTAAPAPRAGTPTTAHRAQRAEHRATGDVAAARPRPAARPTATPGEDLYSPDTPLPPAAPPPPAEASTRRVAVIGDSLADNLAGGLLAWEQTRSDVVIYNLALPGCPISRGGEQRFPDGFVREIRPGCGWWADPESDRARKLAEFDPDVVVVQDSGNELPERKLPEWPTYLRPGDAVYDTWMIDEYQEAIATLTDGDTTVVLLNAVCGDWATLPHWEDGSQPPRRQRAVNLDYQAMDATDYSLHDLDGLFCPDGEFTDTVAGVEDARPDGYHLSDEAALTVAQEWLGPILLEQRAT